MGEATEGLGNMSQGARRECAAWGHDFSVTTTVGSDGPQRVVCDRCGKSWRVVED